MIAFVHQIPFFCFILQGGDSHRVSRAGGSEQAVPSQVHVIIMDDESGGGRW